MNLYDEISKVAYEIWLKKGMPAGNDMENWLEAEQIVYASLRQRDDSSIESIAYSVTTVAPISDQSISDQPISDQPISTGATEEKPAEKKKRGPYKKKQLETDKKATKKANTESKKTEKKPSSRKQRAE